MELDPTTGVLLHGPPGTGKTLVARAVANAAECNFIALDAPTLLDGGLGTALERIGEAFAAARDHAPCVVFIDELDAIARDRQWSASPMLIEQLLTELDGVEQTADVTVVAATNRPGALDDAVTRSGRFDVDVELACPDGAGRREILAIHTRDRPVSAVDLDAIAAQTAGFTGGDLAALCRQAARLAVREAVDENVGPGEVTIEQTHFERAVERLRAEPTSGAADPTFA